LAAAVPGPRWAAPGRDRPGTPCAGLPRGAGPGAFPRAPRPGPPRGGSWRTPQEGLRDAPDLGYMTTS
ncbi:hypothetical protein HMPREF0731_1840, partial [Pseudoroseomonas cervicalis ATCC 49957]